MVCIIITGVFALGNNHKITRIEFPTIGGNLPDNINFTLARDIKFSDDKLRVNTQGFTDKVYKLSLKQENKEERVEMLKKIFNLETSQETDMGEVITFQNENSSLDINGNGTFSYTRKNTNSSKAITLSDIDCITLAEKFLKEKELLPDGFFENGVAYETKTSVKNPADSTIVKKDIYFNRKIDGKKVYGVSRIIVTVGADDQIDSVYSLYRNFDKNPTSIKTKSFDEAFNDLKQLKGTVRAGETTKSVNVKNVELVYWEDSSPYSEQTHIQPVFHFKGEAIDDKGNKDDTFEAFIPAIPDNLTVESKKSQAKSIPSDKKPEQSQSKSNKGNLPKK
jgi:hypothetical protein